MIIGLSNKNISKACIYCNVYKKVLGNVPTAIKTTIGLNNKVKKEVCIVKKNRQKEKNTCKLNYTHSIYPEKTLNK